RPEADIVGQDDDDIGRALRRLRQLGPMRRRTVLGGAADWPRPGFLRTGQHILRPRQSPRGQQPTRGGRCSPHSAPCWAVLVTASMALGIITLSRGAVPLSISPGKAPAP